MLSSGSPACSMLKKISLTFSEKAKLATSTAYVPDLLPCAASLCFPLDAASPHGLCFLLSCCCAVY